jgi:hypothetical protein
MFAPDAQKRVEFAVDTDIDVLSGVRAHEMQPFHSGLRVSCGAVGANWVLSNALEWPNSDLPAPPVHSAVSGEVWGGQLCGSRQMACFKRLQGDPTIVLNQV